MKTETRYISNIFWSWRRYLHAQLATRRIFCNPAAQPKPSSVDQWLIFFTGTYMPALFATSHPRILCVARDDKDGSDMETLATEVLNILDKQPSGRRTITLYDKTSGESIGTIEIIDVSVSPNIFYAEGTQSRAIDITTRVKTARRST